MHDNSIHTCICTCILCNSYNHMGEEGAILGKIALTTVQIALALLHAFYLLQCKFFPNCTFRPYDYLLIVVTCSSFNTSSLYRAFSKFTSYHFKLPCDLKKKNLCTSGVPVLYGT